MRQLVRIRHLVQISFLVLFVYILWSSTHPLTGALPSGTFFKADPLIMVMTALSERVWLPGLGVAFAMLGLTLLFGRFFCGWVCPLGTMMDITSRILRRDRWERRVSTRRLRYFKFGILSVVFLAALAGIQVAWVLDPMVITGRFVSLNLIPAVTKGIDSAFVFAMTTLGARDTLIDVYRWLNESLLGVQVHFFANAGAILVFFIGILATVALSPRFWCRCVCPLGAFYALFAKAACVRRLVDICKHCTLCINRCRMGAIEGVAKFDKGECILCMDCVYDCPYHGTRFGIVARIKAKPTDPGAAKPGLSRRSFLWLLGIPLVALGRRALADKGAEAGVIRPPASLPETEFLDRCVRCGNCMKVCVTNGLQPLMLEEGPEGLWTPRLVPEIGYCEHQCTLCGEVCPTGAIRRLGVEEKKRTRLGLAVVDRSVCISWAHGKECLVCEEHCPVAEKAIKVERHLGAAGVVVGAPVVDPNLCVGCGICQNKCPARPDRAIRVAPLSS